MCHPRNQHFKVFPSSKHWRNEVFISIRDKNLEVERFLLLLSVFTVRNSVQTLILPINCWQVTWWKRFSLLSHLLGIVHYASYSFKRHLSIFLIRYFGCPGSSLLCASCLSSESGGYSRLWSGASHFGGFLVVEHGF